MSNNSIISQDENSGREWTVSTLVRSCNSELDQLYVCSQQHNSYHSFISCKLRSKHNSKLMAVIVAITLTRSIDKNGFVWEIRVLSVDLLQWIKRSIFLYHNPQQNFGSMHHQDRIPSKILFYVSHSWIYRTVCLDRPLWANSLAVNKANYSIFGCLYSII